MDGVITRSEALTVGLTDQQVVTLEMAVAANKVADEEFRRRIELQALAAAYPGLTGAEVEFRLGLEAIAENLRETNRTAEQFNLEEVLRPALERVESAFSGLFEKPSREQAQLQLRIDQLELKRSEAKAKGKSDEQLKAIDQAIEAVRLQKDILDQRSDILKDEAVLADQTLLTEKERTFAAALYTIAIKDGSTAVDRATAITTLQTIAQENYIRSLNNASGALGGSADPFTPEQKRWINGVARSRNEAEPFPGFATGIDFVPRDMIANIHRGERIIPASQNIRGESGTTGANIAYVTINAQGEIAEATARKLAREVTRTLKEELDIETLSGQRLPVGVYSSR
jgi:hypothetical protein